MYYNEQMTVKTRRLLLNNNQDLKGRRKDAFFRDLRDVLGDFEYEPIKKQQISINFHFRSLQFRNKGMKSTITNFRNRYLEYIEKRKKSDSNSLFQLKSVKNLHQKLKIQQLNRNIQLIKQKIKRNNENGLKKSQECLKNPEPNKTIDHPKYLDTLKNSENLKNNENLSVAEVKSNDHAKCPDFIKVADGLQNTEKLKKLLFPDYQTQSLVKEKENINIIQLQTG